jgi:hypothetical protein
MEINIARISLTYWLGGEYLLSKGKYKEARVSKGKNIISYDCGVEAPECIIDRPMKTVETPVFSEPKQTITLSNEFVKFALTKPENPFKKNKDAFYKWLKSPKGRFYQEFDKLTNEQKIHKAIMFYVEDMTGNSDTKFTYKLI